MAAEATHVAALPVDENMEGVRQMVTTALGLALFPPVSKNSDPFMASTDGSSDLSGVTMATQGDSADIKMEVASQDQPGAEVAQDDECLSLEAKSDIMAEVLDTNHDPSQDVTMTGADAKVKTEEVMIKCDFCEMDVPKAQFPIHLRSSKHRRNKTKRKKRAAGTDGSFEGQGTKTPREPVEMKHDPDWQKKVQESKEPLIGLQYMVELVREDPELKHRFWCQMCGTKDSQLMQHIVSRNHRLTYIKKYYDAYLKEINTVEPKGAKNAKISEVAAKIVQDEGGIGEMKLEMDVPGNSGGDRNDFDGDDSMSRGAKRARRDQDSAFQGQGQASIPVAQPFNNPMGTIQTSGSSFLLREMQYTVELLNRDSIRSEEESRVALLLSNQLLSALCNYKNVQDTSMYCQQNNSGSFAAIGGGMAYGAGNNYAGQFGHNDVSGTNAAQPKKRRNNKKKKKARAPNAPNFEEGPNMGDFYVRDNEEY